MPHELITLQLGSYSNYVGSHFWNLQDEVIGFSEREEWWNYTAAVDNDVLYAPGEDKQGRVTYRPRALFVDLSGSLGGVRFTDDGSTAPAASASSLSEGAGISTWGGGLEVHRAHATPKSRFVRELEAQAELEEEEEDEAAEARQASLEEAARELNSYPHRHAHHQAAHTGTDAKPSGVKYWTDFLKVLLAPKSVYTLPGMWQGSTTFSGFADGTELLMGKEGLEVREELLDRLRSMGEACDQLQGFLVLVDDLSGFGGIAAHLAQEINQEYGGSGRPLLLFALRPPVEASLTRTDGLSRLRHGLNEGLALTSLSEHCQMYVPTSPPINLPTHLHYPPSSHFHTSALLAAALDTATMPVRMADSVQTPLGQPIGGSNLHSLVKLLQGHGRGGENLTSLAVSFPAPHLPANMQQLGEMTDARMSHPHGPASVAAAGSATSVGSTAGSSAADRPLQGKAMQGSNPDSWVMPLTEGIQNTAGACLSQSTTLRGPRTANGPAHCSTAHSELMALLQRGAQRRCVQHHCVHPLPLLLPLPFPRFFTASVGLNGDLASQNECGVHQLAPAGASSQVTSTQAPAVHDVRTVPVMTQLAASAEFEGYLNKVAQNWRRAAGSGFGQTTLESWGISKADVGEMEESIHQAASTYAEGKSDTEL